MTAIFVIFGAGKLCFAKSRARSLAIVDDNGFEYNDITVYMGQFYVRYYTSKLSYWVKIKEDIMKLRKWKI